MIFFQNNKTTIFILLLANDVCTKVVNTSVGETKILDTKFMISELPEGTACHVREQRGAKRWQLSKGCRPRFLFRSEKN